MRIERLARSPGVRQVGLQAAVFMLAFVIASLFAVMALRRVEVRAARAEITQLEDDTTDLLKARGEAALVAHLNRPLHDSTRAFRLEAADGKHLAGALPPLPGAPTRGTRGWVEARLGAWPGGRRILAYVRDEPGGFRLTVGEDLSVDDRRDEAMVVAGVGVAALLALLGLLTGARAGREVLRRVDGLAQATEAFAAGERHVRAPVTPGAGGPLDELARALNRMMQREENLVAGLRQVTSSLAHDLRRPLARHNHAIAELLAREPSAVECRAALATASEQVDEVLKTFQALLHIAELEAGAPGLTLAPVDLAAVAGTVVEAYAPAAEAGGRTLRFAGPPMPASVMAESRVLGRMVSNLVENALVHTPAGTTVDVRVEADGPLLLVRDDGPGVPAPERARILERFYRLDASRSTAGSGLGLPLAAAACRAFGGELTVEAADPGLRVLADFSGQAAACPSIRPM